MKIEKFGIRNEKCGMQDSDLSDLMSALMKSELSGRNEL